MQSGAFPSSITYTVYASDDDGVSWKRVKEYKSSGAEYPDYTVTLSLDSVSDVRKWLSNGQKRTAKGLPVYALKASTDTSETRTLRRYKVLETWNGGLFSPTQDQQETIDGQTGWSIEYTPGAAGTGYTNKEVHEFTNQIKLAAAKITKIWIDNTNTDEIRPIGKITENDDPTKMEGVFGVFLTDTDTSAENPLYSFWFNDTREGVMKMHVADNGATRDVVVTEGGNTYTVTKPIEGGEAEWTAEQPIIEAMREPSTERPGTYGWFTEKTVLSPQASDDDISQVEPTYEYCTLDRPANIWTTDTFYVPAGKQYYAFESFAIGYSVRINNANRAQMLNPEDTTKNWFVFVNEQTADRKRTNVSFEKTFEGDEAFKELVRGTDKKYDFMLQVLKYVKKEDGSWKAMDPSDENSWEPASLDNCGLKRYF